MRERPIIFNREMVRALLDGRKTQTRRIVKPSASDMLDLQVRFPHKQYNINCPFGAVGDRLWVRETWQCTSFETNEYGHVEGVDYMREILKQKPQSPAWGVSYEANGFDDGDAEERGFPWRPSIHMPRWASRITLEITGVRVERLQDISEADARAEGTHWSDGKPNEMGLATELVVNADEEFAHLWRSIYGEESWQANPWVWVIEFKRVEAGSYN